ncbi:MAG: hypothetical protein J6O50_03220 [Ruminiclostridium sp.]|nr:hypothetical protein [Ruminiclostridium sp.]
MPIFRRTIAYAAAAAMVVTALFSLSSCRDSGDDTKKGTNYFFTTVIEGSPVTLDPQTCSGDNAAQIIANVFRGLYRISDGGTPVPAMAESVSVSDDGLVYTFGLSDNVMWYGKDGFSAECTADDFVFAFRRLFDPSLRSGRAAEYYCIKNAEAYHTGKITDPDEIGVKASGKHELTITLSEPRTDIEALLAAAPAMPCSREYYELTEGQYGLVGDCVGSNGAFYVSRWHYDKWVKDGNFIELRRNSLNEEALGTAPRGVTFMINADGYENFTAGTTDILRTADPDAVFRLSGKYECDTYSDAVWGVLFNNSGVFASTDLRIALGGLANSGSEGDTYTPANCIIPADTLIGDSVYRSSAGYPTRVQYSEDELLERGERAMRQLEEGALSGMKLIMPEHTALRQVVGGMIGQWQKSFGIYCMTDELTAADYTSALSAGRFDAAMVRLSGNGAVSYLSDFTENSVKNYGGVSSRKLDDIIKSALTAKDDSSAAVYCLEAEQLVLDNGWFAPLCFEKEYIFRASGVSGVEYDPTCGGFIFAGALKK